MSDDDTNPSDADNAAFEELIQNLPETSEEDGPVELSNLWEGYEYIWKRFNPGTVVVKGIVFTEYVNDEGERSFRWQTSPGLAPWEAMGMLQQALLDVQSDNLAQAFVDILSDSAEDDEDDIEDEQ
jgi:hypothetical protein